MGYESLMLACAIVSAVAAVASFELALIKALNDKKYRK